jgi:GntR family transcriptional repressor for pyruvate dehydrogenase complex
MSVRPRFERIERRTVAEDIRRALLDSIRAGELVPGTQLPSERDLSVDFGVARTSVREAIQGLASLGLLEKRGNRSYVIEELPAAALDAPDPDRDLVRELFEVRRVVEIPIARLAAERASPGERREIRRLSLQFGPDLPIDELRGLDRAFHWALACACGNELLAELYGKVLDHVFRSVELDQLLGEPHRRHAVGEIVRGAVEAHRAIGRGIMQGDADAVAHAATRHLLQVEDQLLSRVPDPAPSVVSTRRGDRAVSR